MGNKMPARQSRVALVTCGTLAEAMSGFAALNGEPGRPPLLPPLALADGVTAFATAFSIMVALHARAQTGRRSIERRRIARADRDVFARRSECAGDRKADSLRRSGD